MRHAGIQKQENNGRSAGGEGENIINKTRMETGSFRIDEKVTDAFCNSL